MTVRARWIRILSLSLLCSCVIGGFAFADDHGGEAAAQAASEAVEAGAEGAEASVEAAGEKAEQAAQEVGEAAQEAADDAAEEGEEAAEAEKPKCSHAHWNYCEAAGKCVQAWRCSAGTFAWPADNCECCVRTGLSGTVIRCLQCLPKNCVFPQNCPDPGAALECRYEPPPVGMR